MKRIFTLFAVLMSYSIFAQEFVLWQFNSDNTTTTIGTGTITLIGGTTNTYAGGISSGRAFNTSGYPAVSANNETAGVRFNVSTAGKSGIILFWSQRHSNTSSKFTKIQISTDGTNFNTVDLTSANTTGSTGNFDFVNDILEATAGDTWFARRINLTGVTGVDNNPNFAFRVVTSFGTGTSYVAATNTSTYGTSGTIRFDDVAVGENSILPISLSSFNGSINNNKALLQWQTTSEINFSHFEIEKSVDGTQFTKIAAIKGTNSSGNNYSYLDEAINGITYYRLKNIDKDGTSIYSKTVKLENISTAKFQIFPNPVVNNLVVNHQQVINGVVIITTVEGKVLLQKNIASNASQTIVEVSNLQKGNYIIQLNSNGKVESKLFIK